MRVERIHTSHELAQLGDQWNALAGDSPFARWEWLRNWWRHYGANEQLYVLAAWENDQLCGLAPLMLRQRPGRGRCLELLGSGEVCTDYLGVLTQESHRAETIAAMAQWLATAADDDRWDLMYLEGCEASERGLAPLVAGLELLGASISHKPVFNCWRLELPDNWEDYIARQSKSHRKQLRRLERRVLETDETHLHTITNPADLTTGWDILVDLHQRRRKSLGEPGCFSSEAFGGFLHEAAFDLMQAGHCRLHWLEHHGKPIAAEIHFTADRVAYAYQAGVDPDSLDLEPGRLITMAVIRQAIEEGYRAIDFLRGDEPYKAHFRAEPLEMQSWRVAAPRVSAHMRQGVITAGENLKDILRGGMSMMGLR